ncbi:MAG: aldose 1-epimerase family protein [Oscillospiraceae bacterium]|nr:aldose 1-epimerase family protein [Oscillospiraceae bacterium]
MQVTISSDKLNVTADSFGAELHSVKGAGGTEYLWQAAPNVWKRHAPVLFPFICNTASKKYTCEGAEYSLSNHGFARDSEFELVSSSEDTAEFLLNSSGKTKEIYPYDFALYVKYTVCGNKLSVEYTVKNTDSKDIFFFIGGHPAFRVPVEENESFDDYRVEYEKPETIIQEFNGKTTTILDNAREVPVSHELFANDVFMKERPNSSWVALASGKSGRRVKLSFDNSGCIAVWSSYFSDSSITEQAEFVCLEPWSSVPVYCDDTEEITKMAHAVKLAPDNTYKFAYSIEIE